MLDNNQAIFDSVADSYEELSLFPAEREALRRLRDRLPEISMLDIGVGAGRTGYTFAPLVERYVGVDYSERMIARSRRLLAGEPGVELLVADARDLSEIEGAFDFALFSFNGIDAVNHDDRLRVLTQIRSKLRPDGLFLFSSHSLGALPLSPRRRRGRRKASHKALQLAEFGYDLRYGQLIRRSNRQLDMRTARQRGWTVVRDPAHGFRLDVYYIDPVAQLEQLAEADLEAVAVIDEHGVEVDPSAPRRDAWLNYLCRPRS